MPLRPLHYYKCSPFIGQEPYSRAGYKFAMELLSCASTLAILSNIPDILYLVFLEGSDVLIFHLPICLGLICGLTWPLSPLSFMLQQRAHFIRVPFYISYL